MKNNDGQVILKTLCYADVFDYPLTAQEIFHYQISNRVISQKDIETTLKKLAKMGEVEEYESYSFEYQTISKHYVLKKRTDLFVKRLVRETANVEKLEKTRKAIDVLARISSVVAVYLTGAVAMNNADQDDDIDLMIITESGQLWVTRLVVTLIFDWLGWRRKPEFGSRVVAKKDLFCLNLYLDTDSLQVPLIKQNLYTAHEVIQARLLWQRREGIHTRFLRDNNWIKKFLAATPLFTSPKWSTPTLIKINSIKKPLFWVQICDYLAYKTQTIFMHSKRTTELIKPQVAYFHPRNTSEIVLQKYHQRLVRYGLL